MAVEPRLRKACDRCHAQKLGCQRQGNGNCVRCTRANKQCSWSISLRNRRYIQTSSQDNTHSGYLEAQESSAADASTGAIGGGAGDLTSAWGLANGHTHHDQEEHGMLDSDATDKDCEGSSDNSGGGGGSAPGGAAVSGADAISDWQGPSMADILLWDTPSPMGRMVDDNRSLFLGGSSMDIDELPRSVARSTADGNNNNNHNGNSSANNAHRQSRGGLVTPAITDLGTWTLPDEIPALSGTPARGQADAQHPAVCKAMSMDASYLLSSLPPLEMSNLTDSSGGSKRATPPGFSRIESHWLFKILEINIRLYKNSRTASSMSEGRDADDVGGGGSDRSGGDDGESDRTGDDAGAFDEAISLAMQLTDILQEINDAAAGGTCVRTGDTRPQSLHSIDSGSVLMILSCYMRLLEIFADLLQAISHDTATTYRHGQYHHHHHQPSSSQSSSQSGQPRLQLPSLRVGSSCLDGYPVLSVIVFLDTVEHMMHGIQALLLPIVRGLGKPGADDPSASFGRRVSEPGSFPDGSLHEFTVREHGVLKIIKDIRVRLGKKRNGTVL
ncbi:hypothetical protein CRV24_010032 [Beauveria bassiana]|nr:hypothetical protein CRV24_010032 [Beauveria bassiana]KAH8708330.1 Isoflavipucine cluster transcription factor [Beauveria bassiana]